MRTACRRLAAGLAPLLLLAVTAGPAAAHGTLIRPLSRAAACAPDSEAAGSAACRAAVAAGADVAAWDDVRVPDVAGRDRQLIPDGHLCSGNLDRFHGLDLARDDWPGTLLTPGSTITFRYRATIPHRGSFRFYLTRSGYRPSRPLAWSDLGSRPFLTVTDPPLVNGAYQLRGTLPADRTGPHVIYTIWQTSSTPDTYYSCSDVVFAGSTPASHGGAADAPGTPKGGPTGTAGTSTGSPAAVTGTPTAATGSQAGAAGGPAGPADPAAASSLAPVAASQPADGPGELLVALGTGAILAALLILPLLWRTRRVGAHRVRPRPDSTATLIPFPARIDRGGLGHTSGGTGNT